MSSSHYPLTADSVVQSLPAPEFCLGAGAESIRRLTWRTVYRGSCYYLTLTVSQRFARSQLALNGFVLETRKHSMLTQVCLRLRCHLHLRRPICRACQLCMCRQLARVPGCV